MRVTKNQPQNAVNLLLLLSGILLPAGLQYSENITARIVFITTNPFSDRAILYHYSYLILLEIAMVIGLVVLMLSPKKLMRINFYFELKTFKRLGVFFITLWLVNVLFNYFTTEQFDAAIRRYMEEEPIFFESLEAVGLYTELYSTILKYALLLALYYRLIAYTAKNNV